MPFFVSESPQRLRAAVILALKHVSAAQLSEAVQRRGGLCLTVCHIYRVFTGAGNPWKHLNFSVMFSRYEKCLDFR